MINFTKRFCFLLVFIVALSSCSNDSKLPQEPALKTADLVDYFQYSQIEKDILQAVNDHRISKGLEVLSRVDGITIQAYDHNVYMIENKQVNHDNFSKRYSTLVNEVGAKAVSENVGYGYRTADAVVSAWLNSDGHRENIEGDFTHFGVSVEQDEDGKNYFTNIFVKR